MTLFRANTTTVTPVDTLTIASPDGYPLHEPPIAMGDFDGDSKWGTFAGTCSDKKEAIVQAAIQAPPVWTWGIPALKGCANDWEAFAHFGYTQGEIDRDRENGRDDHRRFGQDGGGAQVARRLFRSQLGTLCRDGREAGDEPGHWLGRRKRRRGTRSTIATRLRAVPERRADDRKHAVLL